MNEWHNDESQPCTGGNDRTVCAARKCPRHGTPDPQSPQVTAPMGVVAGSSEPAAEPRDEAPYTARDEFNAIDGADVCKNRILALAPPAAETVKGGDDV